MVEDEADLKVQHDMCSDRPKPFTVNINYYYYY